MITIRLARFGKKKQPMYRVAVGEKKHSPTGRIIEYLGNYNPKTKALVLEKEKTEQWLKKGASYSRTVGMLLIKEGLLKKEDLPKIYQVTQTKKKKKQTEEAPASTPAPAETPAQ